MPAKTPMVYCLEADQIPTAQTSIDKSCTIPHNFSFTIEYVSGRFTCNATENIEVGIKSDHNGYADATPSQTYLFYPSKVPVSYQPNMIVQRLSERVWIPISAAISGNLVFSAARHAATPVPPGSAGTWSVHLEVHGYLLDLSS
jgi:hypothetical protein